MFLNVINMLIRKIRIKCYQHRIIYIVYIITTNNFTINKHFKTETQHPANPREYRVMSTSNFSYFIYSIVTTRVPSEYLFHTLNT